METKRTRHGGQSTCEATEHEKRRACEATERSKQSVAEHGERSACKAAGRDTHNACEPNDAQATRAQAPRIAVFCVGNRLMLDDGIGPAVYDELASAYELPENVSLIDVGCMSLDMISYVDSCDFIITVDAVDGTDAAPGTVFSFAPDDMARHSGATASLHDLKLIDLFDAAALLGYKAEGRCFGMQAQNISPAELTVGLTQPVYEAMPLLVETVLAQLFKLGVPIKVKSTGQLIEPGWHHKMSQQS